MAFLDNSGDIILDAVLTETGRKKLANGNFLISKFALGDDEINYTTYNKSHPSGSAYYDLEILQTPILEATTQMNSNINYGLLALTNPNILYMPAIVVNEKILDISAFKSSDRVYYAAANGTTQTALIGASALADIKYVISAYAMSGRILLWESGIDSTKVANITANRSAYIVAVDMVDSTFTVQADSRFIGTMSGLAPGSYIKNDDLDNLEMSLTLTEGATGGASTALTNYSDFTVTGITDQLTDTSSEDSQWTALQGPVGTMGGLSITITAELQSSDSRSSLYTDYGSVGQNLFGDGNTYDYIDTVIYVVGGNSGQVIQLPIRITRKAS
tara:strand:+ start:9936 stop:10928 length:993 start_codon:yes stop_codon:yes gene_type:complete